MYMHVLMNIIERKKDKINTYKYTLKEHIHKLRDAQGRAKKVQS